MSELVVLIEGMVAGTLTRVRGKHTFEYSEGYRARPEATPLSVSMPKQVRSHSDAAVTPWLWGLLPDNEAVLARWARQFQASASSPFSMLSTPIGHDCPGAVQFVPADGLERLRGRAGRITWLREEDVAERLSDLKADATAWLGRASTGQFSLAGAQPKTALLSQDGRWGEPSGRSATTHILKPAVAGLDDHDLNEHLCLAAAARAGLTVARSWVGRFGDETAIVIERYDRRRADGRVERVHQEDLCQALGLPPALKYQNEGGPGPRAIVELFRRIMPARAADDAVTRFLDALIWNWLIAGTDAHAKNYSLLLAADDVRLGPLYDIASALPYGLDERKLRFAMKLGRDYAVYPRRDPWPGAAADLGLDPGQVAERVAVLARIAPDAFSAEARSPEVAALKRKLPARLVDLVAERSARCLRLVTEGH